MFNRNIYNLNWRRLVTQLVPTEVRKPRFMALITALLSPVAFVFAAFNNYKLEVEYRLKITPQVCRLQMFLNDQYDIDLRRIKIIDGEFKDTLVLWLENEARFTSLPNEGDAEAKGIIYLQDESMAVSDDFIVVMPIQLKNINQQQLRARIDAYKLPTKQYSIKYE